MSKRFKYCLPSILSLIAISVYSQQTNDSNQAVVTIVGDAPEAGNDPHDFINSNPYAENNEPQIQQELTSQNIEPTLENGFHVRFELNQATQEYNMQKADNPVLVAGISSNSTSSIGNGGASVGKSKKHTPSMAERSFNAKKRLNTWLPKRKKRYHPHLCGRF